MHSSLLGRNMAIPDVLRFVLRVIQQCTDLVAVLGNPDSLRDSQEASKDAFFCQRSYLAGASSIPVEAALGDPLSWAGGGAALSASGQELTS